MSNLIQTPTVDDSVYRAYSAMSKRNSNIHFAVLKHDEGKGIIAVESESNGSYAELVQSLPRDDARWVLLNARYVSLRCV